MSNFLSVKFLNQVFYKLPESITKVYKPLFINSLVNCNCTSNGHTNHGVVTSTDKAHHRGVGQERKKNLRTEQKAEEKFALLLSIVYVNYIRSVF